MIKMKQPKIKLFDQVWDVLRLEFDEHTGDLNFIVYKQYHGWTNIVIESKYVDYGNGEIKLEKPIVHPHEDFVIAPNLNDLFVSGDQNAE